MWPFHLPHYYTISQSIISANSICHNSNNISHPHIVAVPSDIVETSSAISQSDYFISTMTITSVITKMWLFHLPQWQYHQPSHKMAISNHIGKSICHYNFLVVSNYCGNNICHNQQEKVGNTICHYCNTLTTMPTSWHNYDKQMCQ